MRAGRGDYLLGAAGLVVAAILVHPGLLPGGPLRLGSLAETFRPWLAALSLPLALAALWRRTPAAWIAALLPAAAWTAVYGGALFSGPDRSPYDLTVVQHNLSDVNPDPAGTARTLLAAGADLIAVQELLPAALPAYQDVLGAEYPYRAASGTVALWSRHPLTGARPVDLRPGDVGEGWDRGLRATARTPHGDVAVHVAHLPSVRIGVRGFGTARRDESAALLGRALAAERPERVILLGDLNSTTDDRGLAPVTSRLDQSGPPMAFSWPARFPVARIDQVLARSATVTHLWTLDRTGSDHLPVAARIRL
jgi:vancomycin resistance protein VanJ